MENVVKRGLIHIGAPTPTATTPSSHSTRQLPGDMRAPGAATGMNLFECAMDEIAYAAGIDPLQFRLLNYTDVDAISEKQFTSKALREAYDLGSAKVGWQDRPLEPRSIRDGHELTGWGMATGIWDTQFMKATARARLSANGDLEITTAASDIGTGTYTIPAQVASETLGVPLDDVTVRIGDSDCPRPRSKAARGWPHRAVLRSSLRYKQLPTSC